MITNNFFRCPTHKVNRRLEYVTGAAAAATLGEQARCSFVRSHFHEGDSCLKWAGIRDSDPLACAQDGCSRILQPFTVRGKISAEPCGSRCIHARRDDCECQCGGQNHGTAGA